MAPKSDLRTLPAAILFVRITGSWIPTYNGHPKLYVFPLHEKTLSLKAIVLPITMQI